MSQTFFNRNEKEAMQLIFAILKMQTAMFGKGNFYSYYANRTVEELQQEETRVKEQYADYLAERESLILTIQALQDCMVGEHCNDEFFESHLMPKLKSHYKDLIKIYKERVKHTYRVTTGN